MSSRDDNNVLDDINVSSIKTANTPSAKDLLIKLARSGAMTSEASFNKRALSLSSLTALFKVNRECFSCRHSFSVIPQNNFGPT